MQHTTIAALVTLAAVLPAGAQWLNYPSAGTPRMKDGTPNLEAPVPRAHHGRPDSSGVWVTEPTPLDEMTKLFSRRSQVFTRPFTIRYSQVLLPDSDILEYVCAENERDRSHL